MMAESHDVRRSLAFAAAGLLLAAGTALGAVTVSDPFLTIRATSTAGTSTYVVNVPSGAVMEYHDADNDLWWTDYTPATPTPIPMFDGPNLIGVINSYGEIAYRAGFTAPPYLFGIDLSFNVNAGPLDTTFEIFSTRLSFDALQYPEGTASAGWTATDSNGDFVLVTPGLLSGHAYLAEYNGGTDFRRFLSTALFNPNGAGTDTGSGNMAPPGSFEAIGVAVSSLDLLYRFTVSANDQTGGTTSYYIIPAPTSLSLIGLGALATARRRRR